MYQGAVRLLVLKARSLGAPVRCRCLSRALAHRPCAALIGEGSTDAQQEAQREEKNGAEAFHQTEYYGERRSSSRLGNASDDTAEKVEVGKLGIASAGVGRDVEAIELIRDGIVDGVRVGGEAAR